MSVPHQSDSTRSGHFVGHAGEVTVVRNDKKEQLHVQPTAQPKKPLQFEWRNLSEDIVYLKLEDFTDEAAISQLYAEPAAIEQAKYLIIDVRVNYGGTDSLYYPLFKYLPQGKAFRDLDLPTMMGWRFSIPIEMLICASN